VVTASAELPLQAPSTWAQCLSALTPSPSSTALAKCGPFVPAVQGQDVGFTVQHERAHHTEEQVGCPADHVGCPGRRMVGLVEAAWSTGLNPDWSRR